MVCLQTLRDDVAATAQREYYDCLKHFLRPEAEDAEAKRVDSDLQDASEPDSEEAWRTMAEARWRWEIRGAIAARASMARQALGLDLKGCRPGTSLPPYWQEG
eukprot:51860-Alexandrium_andersonii.AAC.1